MKALQLVTGICYPLIVYAGLTAGGPRLLAVTLAAVLALQAALAWSRGGRALVSGLVVPAAGLGGVLLLAGLFNQGQFFLFVPVLINGALLFAFTRTLVSGPPMIERFARLRGHELSAEKIVHCRRTTVVWCLFFVVNGVVSLWLALYGSLEWWTFYTGGLSYLLVGILLGTERVYRYWRFRS